MPAPRPKRPFVFARSVARAALLFLPLLAAPAAAQAAGELVLWEFSPGLQDDPAAQYVALRVGDAPREGPWRLRADDAYGAPQPGLAVLDGAQLEPGTLLLTTPEAADAYALVPDAYLVEAALPTGGSGRLCLLEDDVEVDCVRFGAFAGTDVAPMVQLEQALTRVATSGVNAVDWVHAATLDPAQYLSGEAGDGGVGDGGTDGGGGTGGEGSTLPDGGVPITPGDGTGGGGIGGGHVPDRETVGCTAGGGSAAAVLLVPVAAWRRRRR